MIMTSIKNQKNWFTASSSTKKMFLSYLEEEKTGSQLFYSLTITVAAIWREKKVDPCYLETKKCSSQLLGARKKIMTAI